MASFPLQNLDSFQDNGWLTDGSIDWIECPYPSDIETLFIEKENSVVENNDELTTDGDDDGDDEDDEDGDESEIEEEDGE